METFKNVLRYLFVAIFSLLLFISLLIYPLIFSLYTSVIDPQNVIVVLRQSNAYATIPKYIFNQTLEDQNQQGTNKGGKSSDADINPKDIRKLLDQKDIQDHIQKITEDTINQFYAQVKERKSDIKIQANVLELKTLAFTALLQLDSGNGKKYSITEMIKCTVISRINKNTGCTQDIIALNREFDVQLKQLDKDYKPGDTSVSIINMKQPLIPIIYTNVLLFPFLLIFITLILIAINVLLFKNKTHGLLETGIDILIAGLFNLVLWIAFHSNVEPILKSMNFDENFRPLATNTLNLIFKSHIFFTIWLLVFAFITIVTSIVILIIAKNKNAQPKPV